ncbi:hypothetical protein HDV04_000173 [Boothiomyces sp. JEL0838]|nr:hypothetical protein HDV04_000173 [Boothiomyces sp. JEL0838]
MNKLKELLPPDKILAELYNRKFISLNAKKQKQLILNLIENKPLDLTSNPKDFIQLGNVLNKNPMGKKYALQLYKKGYELGSNDAEFMYAKLLSEGYAGQKGNNNEAMKHIKKLAGENHGLANHVLALKSQASGDIKSLLNYLNKAAENGALESMLMLGEYYKTGKYLRKDLAKSFEYLTNAQELPMAALLLAEFYKTGDVVEKNPEKVLELTLVAANAGIPVAQHNAASMYFEQGNIPFAVEYFKMAATQKYVQSMFTLGTLYENGYHSVKRNGRLAWYYYNMVVEEYKGGFEDRKAFEKSKEALGRVSMDDVEPSYCIIQ